MSERLEFRPSYLGEFDEIVARFADGTVHVETMDKKGCYIGFQWDDGRYCQLWISSDKKLRYRHEDGVAMPRALASDPLLDRQEDSPPPPTVV